MGLCPQSRVQCWSLLFSFGHSAVSLENTLFATMIFCIALLGFMLTEFICLTKYPITLKQLTWINSGRPLEDSVIEPSRWPCRASLVAQIVKNLAAMQESWAWYQGGEYPLEKGMTTYSSILAWEIPWTEVPGGLQYMGSLRFGHNWATNTQLTL